MLRVFQRAAAVVALSLDLAAGYAHWIERAALAFGSEVDAAALCGKCRCIPQGVALPPPLPLAPSTGELRTLLARHTPSDARPIVVLLPAGLRSVKAPLWAAEAIARWHRDDPAVHLVLVGPALDDGVASAVCARFGCLEATAEPPPLAESAPVLRGGLDGLWWAGLQPRDRVVAWLREADCVINTSDSEGETRWGAKGCVMCAWAFGTDC
jgi:hypothetical protein